MNDERPSCSLCSRELGRGLKHGTNVPCLAKVGRLFFDRVMFHATNPEFAKILRCQPADFLGHGWDSLKTKERLFLALAAWETILIGIGVKELPQFEAVRDEVRAFMEA